MPLYRNAHLVAGLIGSLVDCAAELRDLRAEVVLINDSPDDSDLTHALLEEGPRAQAAFPCRIEVNAHNLGFVRSANRALAEGATRMHDVLLLNSDTIVFPGAFSEMVRVSRLDPMTGFVNPRSNNATLATLPLQDRFRTASPQEAFAGWARLAPLLPPVTYVPTAVGFCLLARWTILTEFGGFDEIYGNGYNEENDLILRAGRRGYRAVLANHAFVWHQGSGSFGLHQTSELERVNALIFNARYPEYGQLCGLYFGSANYRAEQLIDALIPDATGRLDLGFDFTNVVAAHNGTFLAARRLLAGAAKAWRDRFNLHVLCSQEAYDFHRYAELDVPRVDPDGPETFAVMFRVGQPYHLGALELLSDKAAVFGVFMLDTISIDSAPLVTPGLFELWQLTAEHADLFAAISDLTADQYERRFAFGQDVTILRSLLSLDLAEYLTPHDAPPPAAPGYVFVVGNHYWHKDVAPAAEALALADPDRTVVVVAGAHDEVDAPTDPGRHAPRPMAVLPNLIRLAAGQLTDDEIGAAYANASVVVFPSHYEGFGFPLLNALAVQRPVFVRPLPVFEEINRALGGEGNLHLFQTVDELVQALRTPPVWNTQTASHGRPGDALRATQDVRDAIETCLSKVSYERIVHRIRTLRMIKTFAPPPPATPSETAPPIAEETAEVGMQEEESADVTDVLAVYPILEAETASDGLVDVKSAPEPERASEAQGLADAEPEGAPPVEAVVDEPDGAAALRDGADAVAASASKPATPRAFVAHRAGLAVERYVYGMLRLPGLLPALRAVARTLRALGGG